MNKNKCSDITLVEITGLIQDLFGKLTGKRPQLWLKAFKLFLRKQNPWIPFKEILVVPNRTKEASADAIDRRINIMKRFDELGIEIWKGLGNHYHKILAPGTPSMFPIRGAHSVVSVDATDLLTLEEIKKFSYEDILKKAEREYDLYPCDILEGVEAMEHIVKETQKSPYSDQEKIRHLICSKTIEVEGEESKSVSFERRIPMFVLKTGNHNDNDFKKKIGMAEEKKDQGWATLLRIDNKVFDTKLGISGEILLFSSPL